MAKAPDARDLLDEVLASLVWRLAMQAVHLAPFMPEKCEQLWRRLGAAESLGSVHDQRFATVHDLDPTGWRVQKASPLFPRPT